MSATPYFQQNISERRRRNIDRIDDMTAKDTWVSGRQLVHGTGEVTFDVVFSVTFAKKPFFHADGVLADNFPVVAGAFPHVGASVVGWNIKGRVEGAFDGYYIGATIAAKVFGADDQQMWIDWSFHEIGLRNPVHVTEDIDDVL